MSKNFPLSKFSKNVYSQNGEDHIILELFNRLEISDFKSLYCCEFGAWDGSYLSNTFNLIEKGASAILIEGCPARFDDHKVSSDQKSSKGAYVKDFMLNIGAKLLFENYQIGFRL